MKNKIIYSISFLAVVGIILLGCQKEKLNVQKKAEYNTSRKTGDSFLIYGKKYTLPNNKSSEQLSIGQLHNQFLKSVFQNFNYSNDFHTELNKQFSLLRNTEDFLDLRPTSKTFEDIVNENLSEQALTLINRAKSLTNEIIDYRSFNTSIIRLIDETKQCNLPTLEKEACLIYMEVLNYSVKFWLNPNKGGSGEGWRILTLINGGEENIPAGISPAAADALAAAGAFIGGAFVTAATGGTGIGIFYSVGWAAAWASGTSALTS